VSVRGEWNMATDVVERLYLTLSVSERGLLVAFGTAGTVSGRG
jgi:hypothetical protein